MIIYKMFIIYLLFAILLVETYASTCDETEVPCSLQNETCIPHRQWCDGEIDCPDGADEYFCDGTGKCLEDHFICENGRCIPFVAVCNGYDNCGDGSDEKCGRNYFSHGSRTTDHGKSQLAVVEAAHYLLSQRKSDYGWDDFTPRALIALSFAEKYLPIPETEKISMLKSLNLQLLLLLRNGIGNLATLALHINALYAMCKDPRDFQGIDLVELLRIETDKAMKSNFNLPIVLLTLCLAKEMKRHHLDELIKIYNKGDDRIGVQALAVIAMASCNHQAETSHPRFETIRRKFIRRYKNYNSNIDVYSKALIYQAFNALGNNASPFYSELLRLQSEDGSFGDLLGTYSVIPVLLNTSLANLQCRTRNYEAKPARLIASPEEIFKPERQIDYSLWIPDGENVGYHTLRVTFDGDKSFYDLMKMAEQRNLMYRFEYDVSEGSGKKVYSLAGIPNDPEKGSTWTLYKEITSNIKDNVTKGVQKETGGVDLIFPRDGDRFIFKLEQSKV